ncbi:HAD family hydrolase [Dethiobacter alkaliphilus]|uniref:HAD-superfamily hydrolase, subfamily IA, variant 3 n=1 Tax=Dethiobacter alkaliphilus AHT 1 TaxID=555088 RepID=C0GDT6_DETAL|nr:HAD family hydrolase [Dethiobacter alkaliphilus]EEG78569.1 HAD-superfamily hydrolase, subfamily IA, variant 3 [Dethiobacter alkaliphilus AHT 1]
MPKAILFDLDGTLLNVDMDDFLGRYLKRLAVHFAHMMDPQEFVVNLMASTQAMIENRDPQKTNREAFWEHFLTTLPHKPEAVYPHIDTFYQDVFPELKPYVKPYPHTPEVLASATKHACPLVLATNPVFPLAAIRHRMNWAGLTEEQFALVTSYEHMHYCKPHPEYYLEIAERINVAPQDCLMIGNDADDDIRAAAKAGMQTYLVKDLVVNKSGKPPQADFSGHIKDIPSFLEKLKEDS